MKNLPVQADEVAAGSFIDLPELLRTFKQYRWGIVSLTVLSMLASGLWALSLPKIYRSTVTILIQSQQEQPIPIKDVYDPGLGRVDYYFTQYEIFKSREIIEPVVDRLKLAENAEFVGKTQEEPAASDQLIKTLGSLDKRGEWVKWLPFLSQDEPVQLSEAEQQFKRREAAIRYFYDHLMVEPVMGTQLVKIHFQSKSAKLATDVANTLADVYLESGLQAQLDATKRATGWLTERLQEIKSQLEKSEQALQKFREQQSLVNVGGTRNLNEAELIDYSTRAREAQRKRTELESTYMKVKQAGDNEEQLKNISTLLVDPLVQRAGENLLAAEDAAKQFEDRYGPKHPKMSTALARVKAAKDAYRQQLLQVAQGVKAEYEIARSTEASMNGLLQGAKSKIRQLDERQYDLGILERDVETNRQLYDLFLGRFKETDTSGDYKKITARIVDRAVPPSRPYEPRVMRIVVWGTAIGFVLAIMLAFLSHVLSEEIRSVEQLEALTHLPVLGVLPLVPGAGRRKLAQHFLEKPNTPFGEGVRSVRAAVQLIDVDKQYKTLMVTSSVPKEGKSSIAATLSLSFAAMERVLLVEADLRLPSLSETLKIPTDRPGLTDLLIGSVSLEDAVVRYGDTQLYVLGAGTRTRSPAEIIASEAFKRMVEMLATKFDRIIFDTPPCHAASDALLLSSHVNAVLFVVKSDSTPQRGVRNAIKQLRQVNANILGTLVNQVNVKRNPYYQDGYHYAYEYYGKS